MPKINLSANNLASGTLSDARFPATLPAISGVNLTSLNASNISSGTLADARLSSNMMKLDTQQTITGGKTFQNAWMGVVQSTSGTSAGLHLESAFDAGTLLYTIISGNANPKFTLLANGKHIWGPGGAASHDTYLYRQDVGKLRTSGTFIADTAIGIGTNSPSQALEVNGNLKAAIGLFSGYLDVTGTVASKDMLTVSKNGGVGLTIGHVGDTSVRFYITTEGAIGWGTGVGSSFWDQVDVSLQRTGASSLQVTGSLHVDNNLTTGTAIGINTTNLSAGGSNPQLHVKTNRTSGNSTVAILISDGATSNTDGDYKAIRAAANNFNSLSELRFIESDGTNNNTAIGFATAYQAGSLREVARITGGGYLGLGTALPSEKFHQLGGNMLLEGGVGANTYFSVKWDSTGWNGSGFEIKDRTTGNAILSLFALGSGYSGYQNNRVLQVDNNNFYFSFSGNYKFALTPAGRLGINNTSPSEALDVTGNIKASGTITGNGSGLTSLNANNLSSGTVPLAQLLGITTSQLSASANIADGQLATISTAGKVSNSATTATSANTASAIVARDASGNFTAGTITATTFSGSGASLTNVPAGSLTGSGTAPDSVLSSNIPRKNTANQFTGSNVVTTAIVNYAASITWAVDTAQVAKLTLTGNPTVSASGMLDGGFYSILLIQDSTGNRTVSWNSSVFKFAGGVAPTLSTAGGTQDIIVFRSNGTHLLEVGRTLGVA